MLAFTRWLIVLGLLLICSACGFKLRTAFDLPQELQTLNVTGGEANLNNKVIRVLTAASVDINKDAAITLKLLNSELSRRVAAVDADAKPSEYELRRQLTYQLFDAEDVPISAPQQVSVVRSYAFAPEQIAAKQQEEDVLTTEMLDELVIKLIRQLPIIPIQFSNPAAANNGTKAVSKP